MALGLTSWLTLVLHAACVLGAAPSLEDLLGQQAAARHGRTPPRMDQAWRDLLRQLRKPALRPVGSSYVFATAPAASLGMALAAALLVPSFAAGMATAPLADLFVVAVLLACSRLLPALATLDTGSAPAVTASAATAHHAAAARLHAEPLLVLAALVIAMLTGASNLDPASLRDALPALQPGSVPGISPRLTIAGLLAGTVLLAAIASEPPSPAIFSGRDLALVSLARQLRRIAALSAVAVIALPIGLAPPGLSADLWLVGLIAWAVKLLVLALLAQLLARHRATLPAAAMLALIAAVLLEAQPAP